MTWLAAGVAYTFAYWAIGSVLRSSPAGVLWFRTLGLVVPPLVGVVVIARRHRAWLGCQWLFWATIAIGLLVSALGAIGWAYHETLLARETSWVGWYGVFVFFGAAMPLFALLAQPHQGQRDAAAPTTAVDIAGIAVLAGFFYSQLAVGMDPASGPPAGPALSLVVLSGFQQLVVLVGLTVAAVGRDSLWTRTYRRLAMGAFVAFAMLLLSNVELWQGAYRSAFVYDFTWILPFFFYPWAAAAAPDSPLPAAEVGEVETAAPARPWLIFGVLAAIPILDRGLRAASPVAGPLEQYKDLSTAITLVSVLPLLIARLAVERAQFQQADARGRLLAAAVERAADLVVLLTSLGRVHYANSAFCRAVGYSPEEVRRLTLQDLTAGEFNLGSAEVNQAVRTCGAWRGAIDRRRKDGSTFTVACAIVPLIDRRSRVLHYVAVERDITEETRLHAQLVDSERRYRSLFHRAPLGIYTARPDGRLLTVNPAIVEMLGYDAADEVLAVSLADLCQDRARGHALLAQWRDRRSFAGDEVVWTRRDGRGVQVRLSGRLFGDEQTGEEAFEVFVEDVSEQRELEEELRQAQKMEAIGRLAGGVAHDFNNQLTVILGYSDLLLSQLGADKPVWHDLAEIRRAAERASGLTRRLLAFSRKQLMNLEVLDLNDVVRGVEPMLRRLLGEDVSVQIHLSPNLDPIKADRLQLEQVLLNLATNARDAMPEGGVLDIETAHGVLDAAHRGPGQFDVRPGEYSMLAVSDTGCGMDGQTKAHLFEPFFTTKDVGKGTGLGLATAYGIVKQIGGYIWAYSEPRQGSTFKVYLPVVAGQASRVEREPPPEALAIGGHETILLVEDEDAVRRFSGAVLRRNGYQVIEAGSGEEALAAAREHEAIDLVLTDVVMPGLSGPDMLARLRAERPLKGLLMSGYTKRILRKDFLGGEVDVIEKPFGPVELLRRVRRVLDRPLS